MSLVQVSDVIVPEIFTPYVQQISQQKSRIIQSGILINDPLMNEKLAGGGITFNMPSQQDLADDPDNVSSDGEADSITADFAGGTPVTRLDSVPLKVASGLEIAVRLSRNNSWSTSDLASALAGKDPMMGIASRVGYYWARRLQAAFIATMNGVIKDNVANDAGDYQNDISGGAYIDGVTNISAEAIVDTAVTMGDSMEGLTAMMVHSIVFARLQKNNLIDPVPDSDGKTQINLFLGREVIVDDSLPNAGGVYDTWLFGGGMALLGTGSPKVPTEVQRYPQAGNGGGQEVLYNRVEWSIHPSGHAYIGTPPNGGPGNGTASNQLNIATSWNRVWPERKMVRFARLVTRES